MDWGLNSEKVGLCGQIFDHEKIVIVISGAGIVVKSPIIFVLSGGIQFFSNNASFFLDF
jgi:hypothetical protein